VIVSKYKNWISLHRKILYDEKKEIDYLNIINERKIEMFRQKSDNILKSFTVFKISGTPAVM